MIWYNVWGNIVFWVSLVVALLLYSSKRKWFPIMYLISIAVYVFSVGYVIDVFDLGENGILLTLAVSSVLMIGAGMYLSKHQRKKK